MDLVPLDAVLDDLDRHRARQRVRSRSILVLQALINLEEMHDLVAVVRRNLVNIVVIIPVRILERDSDDFIVNLIVVNHSDNADRIAVHLDHRVKRFTAQHKHIQRIAVVRIGARDKAVIGRIMRRGIQNTIQPQQTGLLVQLVLFLAACRNLDNRREALRRYAARVNVMPDVHHIFFSPSLFYLIPSITDLSNPCKPCARKKLFVDFT